MFSLPSTIDSSKSAPNAQQQRNTSTSSTAANSDASSSGATSQNASFGGMFSLPSIVSSADKRSDAAQSSQEPTTDPKSDHDVSNADEDTSKDAEQTSTLPNETSQIDSQLLLLNSAQNDTLAQFDQMSQIDQERYKVYMRTKLANTNALAEHLSSLPNNPRINPSVTHIISLIMKEMTGDIMLLALQVRNERLALNDQNDQPPPQGPITEDELREAYRRWREREAHIGRDKWTTMKKNAWRR